MPELDPCFISKAKELVREQFPEMVDIEPSIATREAHGKEGKGIETRYILTFQKGISLQDGARLAQVVRVTMDRKGEVIKFISSR